MEAAADQLATEAGLDEDQRFHIAWRCARRPSMPCSTGTSTTQPATLTYRWKTRVSDLMFIIADQGHGFDPENVPDPLAAENILRGTGRGIFLIRSLMDEVHFRQLHPGTELTLIKHLAPAAEKNG